MINEATLRLLHYISYMNTARWVASSNRQCNTPPTSKIEPSSFSMQASSGGNNSRGSLIWPSASSHKTLSVTAASRHRWQPLWLNRAFASAGRLIVRFSRRYFAESVKPATTASAAHDSLVAVTTLSTRYLHEHDGRSWQAAFTPQDRFIMELKILRRHCQVTYRLWQNASGNRCGMISAFISDDFCASA